MKIFKDNSVIAELPKYPKDFECRCKAGAVIIETRNGAINLGKYENPQEVISGLCRAYFGNADSFNLPKK